MGKFDAAIERLKRPVDYCTGDEGDPDGCKCGAIPKQRSRAAKQRADLDAAIRLLEAAEQVPKWAALQIQPHPSEASDTLMISIAFHKYPDLLDKIHALLAALPEDK